MRGFEYGNTRLRARRSHLFALSDYLDLMGAGSLDRMVAMLADTPYSRDIEAALVRASGLERLDRALSSNLAVSLKEMASFYDQRPGRLVDLLLARWDQRNLRAILRTAGTASAAADVTAMVVPAGRLAESELAELAAQESVAPLVDLMVAWGIPAPESSFALLRARAEYVTRGDLSQLERSIDSAFASEMNRVLGDESTAATVILRAEIDARNLELALRLRAARLEEEQGWRENGDPFLAGGLRDVDVWQRLADADSPEAAAEIAGAASAIPGWQQAVSGWLADDDLILLGDALQRATTAAARDRFVTGDQLGFDIPVAFTFSKEAEIRNLRLIGRALIHHLPMDSIEQSLEVAA